MIVLIKIKIVLLTLLLSSLFHTNLRADTLVATEKKITLTVGIEEVDYFPFNYKENGAMKGFSVDVLNYIDVNSKYNFKFVEMPWPRLLHLVAQGEVDVILTLFRTPERESSYHYIEPSYANEVNQLFTLAGKEVDYDGQLESLIDYTIGTKREYSYGKSFDGASYLNKLPVLTEEVLLNMLLAGRIDLIIGNPFAFNELIIKKKVEAKVKSIKPYVAITPVYMALTRKRKDSQAVNDKFQELMAELINSPYHLELLKKYNLNF